MKMRRFSAAMLASMVCALWLWGCSGNSEQQRTDTVAAEFQQRFQAVDTTITIKSFETEKGETLDYIDEGNPSGHPVLLITGFGTSVTAALLTTHLAQLRDDLDIRLLSLQRNGFGEQAYQKGWNYDNYVEEVGLLLEMLQIDDFHIIAISGGGPYAAFVTQALGARIKSLHLDATITGNNQVNEKSTLPASLSLLCTVASGDTPLDNVRLLLGSFALESAESWWGFSPLNPMLTLDGLEDAAATDWAYTFFSRDSEQSLTALAAEAIRYCDNPLPDLAGITTPLFIYHGDADDSAPLTNIDAWMASLVNTSATTIRLYPGEGHWVQYSRLDQIFADISRPGSLFVCDESEKSILVPEAEGLMLIRDMKATVGLCKTPPP